MYIITKRYLEASHLVSAYEDNSGYNGTSDFSNLDKAKYPAVADGWLSNIYGTGYWLACPVQAYYDYDLLMVGFEKKRTSANHAYFAEAFRPVVCLKSSVILTWNPETNQYDLT